MPQSYEQRRIDKLNGLNLLDTLPEKEFDDVAKICMKICETPAALVSMVDKDRQWFKACAGLQASETPRNIAFCDYTIRERQTFIVEDALLDERFKNNPLVTSEPFVRFYAGAPLWTSDGYCLGSLCVLDSKPRKLSEAQREALEALARQVMFIIETRSRSSESELDRLEAKYARQRLQDVTASMEAGTFAIDKAGRCTFVNDAWSRITGLSRETSLGYAYMSAVVDEDRVRLFEQLMVAREQRTSFKAHARVRHPDGTICHVECHSVPDSVGGRIGTIYDVTEYVTRIEALEKELFEIKGFMLKKA